MTTLLLVRHGETEGNAANLAQGHYDVPLNEKGMAQAKLLAERLKHWCFDAVYSSDSTRTLQTAEPLLEQRPELEIATTPALREKSYGDCENYSWQQLRDEYSEIFVEILDPAIGSDVRFPGGETDREHMHRVSEFLRDTLDKHDDDANILVFSHGGSIKAAAAYMCNLRLEDKWRLMTDNTSINSIVSESTWRDDGWQIERWNDTHHLNGIQLAWMIRTQTHQNSSSTHRRAPYSWFVTARRKAISTIRRRDISMFFSQRRAGYKRWRWQND